MADKPAIEIVIHRDPDGDTTLSYFVDRIEVAPDDLGITEYHIDPGRSGADEEWAQSMEENAAERIKEIVSYYT